MVVTNYLVWRGFKPLHPLINARWPDFSGVKDSIALKLIAAKGKVQVQAQSDDIEIVGDKDLKVTACKETITVVAKDEILVTAGGGYIRLKGGNIEIHCPGKVSVKGANHKVSGPDNLKKELPKFKDCALTTQDAAENGGAFA